MSPLTQEALRRIISTLSSKNEELESFLESVDNTLTGLQDESCKVMSDLEAELELLRSTLEDKGAELRDIIREETQRKGAELQNQLSEGKFALLSCEELLAFANNTLAITDEEEFLKVAADRLELTCSFRTHLLGSSMFGDLVAVPGTPEINIPGCVVRDNTVTVSWRPACDANAADVTTSGPVEHYEVEYRKTNHSNSLAAAGGACWEKIHDIRDTHVTVSGLKFDSDFVVVRVRARNKSAARGVSIFSSLAFSFGFEALTAHAELKVQGDTVTWEPQGIKGHDPRLRGKENKSSSRSGTPSPSKSSGNRAGRERFTGESYTVLGDQEMTGGCHYWELCPLLDWKSFSVGVAYRASLGRFDQLGKNGGSWCLHASQWLQTSLSVKHNNRAKALDWPLPQRIGIYCDCSNGDLMFIDVDRLRLLHAFKAKFNQPLVPAFTVWCGGITVSTGLQVPTFMGSFLSTSRSLSNLAQ
uniref:B30.2/SPRY domain-containing protein n=1 Tax=Takifugu rubripes TaxID=31033 RepID=A0A674P552_TAKRU